MCGLLMWVFCSGSSYEVLALVMFACGIGVRFGGVIAARYIYICAIWHMALFLIHVCLVVVPTTYS